MSRAADADGRATIPFSVLALAVAVLVPILVGHAAAFEPGDPKPQPLEVKVLVLNFDPLVPGTKTTVREVCRWNDPRRLAEGYTSDLRDASRGWLRYRVVEWRDLDEFPAKIDGFRYTAQEFLRCHRENKGWHQPDTLDYVRVFEEHKVYPLVNAGTIDELWIFGAPYFGYSESAMAGPRAFYINGQTLPEAKCRRPFAIMGFSYERGVAEMLHNLCHRVESTMSRVYGGWKAEELTTNWARFAANEKQSGGVAAVGTCHWPPNAQRDYDYNNPRPVQSSADDWLGYPKLTGRTTTVTCETWGGPDYHRNYMKWWFRHLPQAAGVHPDGRLNNWWEYVFRFDAYDDRGKPRPAGKPVVSVRDAVTLQDFGKISISVPLSSKQKRIMKLAFHEAAVANE